MRININLLSILPLSHLMKANVNNGIDVICLVPKVFIGDF